uniref:Ubiquitin carboxyl-terminal hydrolase n=1 Tax=Heterorhabditis bacteriophora TaxID=37862 RepID=A0A1I7WME7_HETBA
MGDKRENQNDSSVASVCEKQCCIAVPKDSSDLDVVETVTHLIETVLNLDNSCDATVNEALIQSDVEVSHHESNISNLTSFKSREFMRTSSLPNDLSINHDRDIFMLKEIDFGSLKYRIVTQNMNGPCPLIAVVNALILKGSLTLSAGESVTREALTHLVANALLQFRPKTMSSTMESNYDKNLDDVINLLPDLGRGLDVNVRFRNVIDFEFTPAMSLFDLLGLNIYHGWLVDPECSVIRELI